VNKVFPRLVLHKEIPVNHFKLAAWRFMKGLMIGFIVIDLMLLVILTTITGLSNLTVMYATSLAGLLAVLIGFQEALNPTTSENSEESSWYDDWKECFSPWEMAWKTFLLSSVSTFCLNIVSWYVYWLLQLEDAYTNTVVNLGPIAIFSVVVGVFYGGYHSVKFWIRHR
jgi:hypothetical protein